MAGGKRLFRYGRVIVLLTGKYAGKKAVILKVLFDGTKERKFPHLLVAGLARSPKKVHKRMSEEKISKRIRIKPFVKYVNMNHIMPTRYMAKPELDLSDVLKQFETQENIRKENTSKVSDPLTNEDFRKELKTKVKKILEKKYQQLELNASDDATIKLKFLFKPLRF